MTDIDLLEYLEGFLTTERKARFAKILSERTNFLTVAIEDVFQLHNTSAILRSCDSFGIQSVHVVEERNQERLDKNIAMGAQKWVDVYRHKSTSMCIDELKNQGYQVIATSPHERSTTIDGFEFSKKAALFFGTEWHGLSQEVLDKADGFLHIPMIGFSESLNVSVSAAIILQTLSKKLRNSNFDWELTEDEILSKRLDWAKKSIKNVEGIIERYHAD